MDLEYEERAGMETPPDGAASPPTNWEELVLRDGTGEDDLDRLISEAAGDGLVTRGGRTLDEDTPMGAFGPGPGELFKSVAIEWYFYSLIIVWSGHAMATQAAVPRGTAAMSSAKSENCCFLVVCQGMDPPGMYPEQENVSLSCQKGDERKVEPWCAGSGVELPLLTERKSSLTEELDELHRLFHSRSSVTPAPAAAELREEAPGEPGERSEPLKPL